VINASAVYPWNRSGGLTTGQTLLSALGQRTDSLFFEIGDIKEMNASQDTWVPENLLHPTGFQSVALIPPPAFDGANGLLRLVADRCLPRSVRVSKWRPLRAARRTIGYDYRDARFLFFATHRSAAFLT
jgi:hypothetical protein